MFLVVGILTGIVMIVAVFGISRCCGSGHLSKSSLNALAPAAGASEGLVAGPNGELPDRSLTPGAVATRDVGLICRHGYAGNVRPRGSLWRRLKDQAYARYKIARGHRSSVDDRGVRHPAFEIDHLIPIELGGSTDDIRNLWPQAIASAKVKDRIENRLHDAVCAGKVSLTKAQIAIARDWKTAYRVSSLR